MTLWAGPINLYKGLATLVLALLVLQYLFGSVLENIIRTTQQPTDEENLLAAHMVALRGHNISKPRFYQGPPLNIEKSSNSIVISTDINNDRKLRISNSSTNFTVTLNDTVSNAEKKSIIQNQHCPLVPPNLQGPVPINRTYVPTVNELESKFSWLRPGGNSSPRNCTATSVVAIIIPYRDRAEHLLLFLAHMHPFLHKQQLDYTIYLIEQEGDGPFNRAMLFNVGFSEAIKHRQYQCFIFHDVDLLPEDDRNLYNCPEQPRHMSVAVDVMKYRLPYKSIFGGVCALTREQLVAVNGFSNMYWGWGAEDDDMSNRIRYNNYHISRYPNNIARYTMLTHNKERANPKRYQTLVEGIKRYKTDGLNSLSYEVRNSRMNLLYTWVLVKLRKPS